MDPNASELGSFETTLTLALLIANPRGTPPLELGITWMARGATKGVAEKGHDAERSGWTSAGDATGAREGHAGMETYAVGRSAAANATIEIGVGLT